MIRLLKILGLVGLAVAVLVWPLAFGIDHTRVTVRQVQKPTDVENWKPGQVDELRALTADPDGDPAELYGVPVGDPVDVVLAGDRVVAGSQHPELSLLYVGEGESKPLQARTVWFFARTVSLGAGIGGIVLLLLSTVLRRRRLRAEGDGATA